MTSELKPCPFCGDKAEIERYGDRRVSTIYTCNSCGCSLETGEEWDHGSGWNTRAVPDVPELVRYGYGTNPVNGNKLAIYYDKRGEYVRHDQAAAVIAAEKQAAIDARNLLQYEKDQQWRERAEAAETKLAQIEKQLEMAMSVHRWSVDDAGNGSLYVCRRNHEKGEPCEWERFIPADTAPVASDADLRAENERLMKINESHCRAVNTLTTDGARLVTECDRYKQALEFYADISKYPAPLTGGLGALWSDCGGIARATLNPSELRT